MSAALVAGEGVKHGREVTVRAKMICVRDVIEGAGRRRLEWRFHLHPSVEARVSARGFLLSIPGVGVLAFESEAAMLSFEVVPSEYSPGYGLKQASRVCIARGEFTLPATVEWHFRPEA